MTQKKFIFFYIGVGLIITGLWFFSKSPQSTFPIPTPPPPTPATTTTVVHPAQPSSTNEIKIYTNTQYGFEFQYPGDWAASEYFINGTLRKFRLVNAPAQDEHLIYNITPPVETSIVTPDRAERLTELFYAVKNHASETKVGGIVGLRYEYEFDAHPRVAIVLPVGQYKLILDSDKKYEIVFGEIISTFKFLNTPLIVENNPPKDYRNAEFGFEFQYPGNWPLYENTFGSPFSKFNLIGGSAEDDGYPDSDSPSFLINVVTPDFADRASSGPTKSNITIGGIIGKRYEFQYEGSKEIGVDLPFGQYHMLLGTTKKYESVFNQILASFKFLK